MILYDFSFRNQIIRTSKLKKMDKIGFKNKKTVKPKFSRKFPLKYKNALQYEKVNINSQIPTMTLNWMM